jgi:hypothetical protein
VDIDAAAVELYGLTPDEFTAGRNQMAKVAKSNGAAVLDAEQAAPEQVRYHFISRHLVQTWIRQQRGKPSFQLTGLAERLKVI